MSNIYGLVKIYGDITEADYPEFILLYFFYEEVASAKAAWSEWGAPDEARRNRGRSRKKLFIPSSFSLDLWPAVKLVRSTCGKLPPPHRL